MVSENPTLDKETKKFYWFQGKKIINFDLQDFLSNLFSGKEDINKKIYTDISIYKTRVDDLLLIEIITIKDTKRRKSQNLIQTLSISHTA